MLMKNSNDTIGNRFRELPVCTVVPQQLRHRVPLPSCYTFEIKLLEYSNVNSRNTHHINLDEVGPGQTISCVKVLKIFLSPNRSKEDIYN
jgi:hypothetical protein